MAEAIHHGSASFTVPSNKRLVVEFASLRAMVPKTQLVVEVAITTLVNLDFVQHFLVPVRTGTERLGDHDYFVASQQMVLHAGPERLFHSRSYVTRLILLSVFT